MRWPETAPHFSQKWCTPALLWDIVLHAPPELIQKNALLWNGTMSSIPMHSKTTSGARGIIGDDGRFLQPVELLLLHWRLLPIHKQFCQFQYWLCRSWVHCPTTGFWHDCDIAVEFLMKVLRALLIVYSSIALVLPVGVLPLWYSCQSSHVPCHVTVYASR